MDVVWILLISATTFLLVTADPCLRDYGGCDKQNGLCWGTSDDTHFCSCKAGYKHDETYENHKCIDAEECLEENPCDKNAFCENTDGSYICHCKCGYILGYTGQHCLDAAKITGLCHLPTSCKHHARVQEEPVEFHIMYAEYGYVTDMSSLAGPRERPASISDTCVCESGFSQNECGLCEDVEECVEDPNACIGPHASCINTEGSFYCECMAGYILGACKKQCFAPGEDLASGCETSLSPSSLSIDPVLVENWRRCNAKRKDPEISPEEWLKGLVEEASDLDQDGKKDVLLEWDCEEDGHSSLRAVLDREAQWTEWTCWSSCKPTCWGGLQTRTRKCLHGEPGLDGCVGQGSESKECYSGQKCPFKVRRDARYLNEKQIIDLIQAMENYKNDKTVKGFFNAASAHGWPHQCDRKACCHHGAAVVFLAWHRTMLLNFEQGLSRYLEDKTLGLPYWNWLAKDPNPADFVWQKDFNGQQNPFTNFTVRLDREGDMRTIQRDDSANTETLKNVHDVWRDVSRTLIQSHKAQEFAASLERIHNEPHVSICHSGLPKCELSLGVIDFAAFDPLFILHHTQIDRLWAVAQQKMQMENDTTWSLQTAVLEDELVFSRRHLPFANKTLNAFPIVQAVNTMRDSYHYKELTGVIYDYLDNDGFPPNEPESRPKGVLLFISHYLKNIRGEEPVYVNYYLNFGDDSCTSLTEEYRIGKHIILPTDTPFNLSVPVLIPVEKIGFGDPDEDLRVKACYTYHYRCFSKCTESTNHGLDTMPSPGLVHHLQTPTHKLPVEIHKFDWSPENIMPQWPIHMKSGSQWIYFYGTRPGRIVQVKTAREWNECDVSSAKPFKCSKDDSACMLPEGLHYLIDVEKIFCQKGLRMIIVSHM